MNNLILTIVSLVLLFHAAFAQTYGESPFAMFGDKTPVLDIDHKNRMAQWTIIVALSDSAFATIELHGDKLSVIDDNGNILAETAANQAYLAMFKSSDPKADEMPWVSPYVYCFGNPIRYVDKTGLRPTTYEAALMASAVYKDVDNYADRILALKDLNWEISAIGCDLQLNHPAQTGIGLQSMVFERATDNGKEYAYVYAGSNSWEDIIEDITQVLGITAQYSTAIKNAKALDAKIGSGELTFVGHSLGGGEAAAASFATGRHAITFNPAALSVMARMVHGLYGSGDIENFISTTPHINITVDFVTNIQASLGIIAPGTCKPIPVGFFPSHSIDKIVNALQRAK